MRHAGGLSGLTALFLGVSSCLGDAGNEPAFAVTDSAGVNIVTTRVPVWPDGGLSPWELTLVTEIGMPDGPDPYRFGGPVSVVLLPGARIAVADDQSSDIRIFGADGEFQTRWGERGMGAGEFETLRWLTFCGDEVAAYDSWLRRLTTFSLDGEVVGTARVETPERNSLVRPYCLPDGSVLSGGLGRHAVDRDPGVHFYPTEATVWRIFPDTGNRDSIGTYLAGEWVTRFGPSRAGRTQRHPFGRAAVFAGDTSRIVIGTGERFEIEVRGLDGALSGIVRGPEPDLEIDDVVREAYRTAHLSADDSAVRATLAEGDHPMPPRYPAYSDILVDEDGYIWVERFVFPWSTERPWGVFDPAGVFLGHVTFPPEFRMTGIGGERVIGVVTDEAGGIRVRVYQLERQPAGREEREAPRYQPLPDPGQGGS